MEKHVVKVWYCNGDSITTTINGSVKEIKEYYAIGRNFNIGNASYDNLVYVTHLDFME